MASFIKTEENVGEIDYEKFDFELNNTVHVVQSICSSKKAYSQTLSHLYRFMKQGFDIPEVRKHPLQFKFTMEKSEPIKTMEIRHFIINLMLWSAFMRYDCVDEINSSQIFDCTNLTTSTLNDYINEHLVEPYHATIENKEINKALDDVIYLLANIYNDFALIMGLTMDMESFIELRDRYPRFNELLNTKPEPGMQPNDIEAMLEDRTNEYISIVNSDMDNNLRPFLVTGAGLNKGQLTQLSIMGGLKPDLEGNVNPVPIDSNFINGGLNSISNFYIDGQAGCKPLILNKTVMGKSGYFSYKTMTLSSNYRVSQNTDDCHSKRPIKYVVKTKKHLKKIHNRFYYDDNGELKKINAKKDHDLIGKIIALRDPATCCSHDGICHVCAGDVWYTINNPMFHAGRFAATQINEPIQQKILSSKHMLRTVSDKISFDSYFSRFFILETNKIKLNMDTKEDITQWELIVSEDDLYYVDEYNTDIDFNVYIEGFYLYNTHTKEMIKFKEENNCDLYLFHALSSELIRSKPKTIDEVEYRHVSLTQLSDSEPFAVINIMNNELTAPLKNITKLLDRKDHFGSTNIDEMLNNLVQLVIDAGMGVDAVHCSMLIKGLIRQKDNVLLPPDFSKEVSDDDYTILSASNALIFNPSLTVSLSFDNANRQILSPLTYKKYKPSDYDLFFKEDLYDESVKYYNDKKDKKVEKKLKELTLKYRKEKAKASRMKKK